MVPLLQQQQNQFPPHKNIFDHKNKIISGPMIFTFPRKDALNFSNYLFEAIYGFCMFWLILFQFIDQFNLFSMFSIICFW